ncbi:LuxR C-terminal-related transcriptional regulator [Paenibacillus sp. SN-8-1]|uniref:LuxR C-terminal-related transcriptional regulator n=1 Tax=Paenibacillus sp. SN-8-1 TaxID=3435409 RepID=UPI003D9A288E
MDKEELYCILSDFSANNPDLILSLSKREREILMYWISDFDYKAISEKLYISENTVRTHIRNINGKLNINSKTILAVTVLLQLFGI